MDPTTEAIIVPRESAAQLALHARLAAHHATAAGAEPAAAEAVLAWAVLIASGGAVSEPSVDGLPTPSDILDDSSALPAYRAAADQAEQLLAHFDDEEGVDLVILDGKVLSIVEGEINRMTPR
jgi:hypothetical protein